MGALTVRRSCADRFDRTSRRTGLLYPAIITARDEDGACITRSFSWVGVACLHGRSVDCGPPDLAVDAFVVSLPSSGPPSRSGSWWLDGGLTYQSATRTLSRPSDDDDLGADLCEIPGELGVQV